MSSYSLEIQFGGEPDSPQDESDTIQTLRANLRSVTDALDDLLEHGFPRKGRSADDREAYANWREEQHARIRRAKSALKATPAFALSEESPPARR